jgi:hypothetical protein
VSTSFARKRAINIAAAARSLVAEFNELHLGLPLACTPLLTPHSRSLSLRLCARRSSAHRTLGAKLRACIYVCMRARQTFASIFAPLVLFAACCRSTHPLEPQLFMEFLLQTCIVLVDAGRPHCDPLAECITMLMVLEKYCLWLKFNFAQILIVFALILIWRKLCPLVGI